MKFLSSGVWDLGVSQNLATCHSAFGTMVLFLWRHSIGFFSTLLFFASGILEYNIWQWAEPTSKIVFDEFVTGIEFVFLLESTSTRQLIPLSDVFESDPPWSTCSLWSARPTWRAADCTTFTQGRSSTGLFQFFCSLARVEPGRIPWERWSCVQRYTDLT